MFKFLNIFRRKKKAPLEQLPVISEVQLKILKVLYEGGPMTFEQISDKLQEIDQHESRN